MTPTIIITTTSIPTIIIIVIIIIPLFTLFQQMLKNTQLHMVVCHSSQLVVPFLCVRTITIIMTISLINFFFNVFTTTYFHYLFVFYCFFLPSSSCQQPVESFSACYAPLCIQPSVPPCVVIIFLLLLFFRFYQDYYFFCFYNCL